MKIKPWLRLVYRANFTPPGILYFNVARWPVYFVMLLFRHRSQIMRGKSYLLQSRHVRGLVTATSVRTSTATTTKGKRVRGETTATMMMTLKRISGLSKGTRRPTTPRLLQRLDLASDERSIKKLSLLPPLLEPPAQPHRHHPPCQILPRLSE